MICGFLFGWHARAGAAWKVCFGMASQVQRACEVLSIHWASLFELQWGGGSLSFLNGDVSHFLSKLRNLARVAVVASLLMLISSLPLLYFARVFAARTTRVSCAPSCVMVCLRRTPFMRGVQCHFHLPFWARSSPKHCSIFFVEEPGSFSMMVVLKTLFFRFEGLCNLSTSLNLRRLLQSESPPTGLSGLRPTVSRLLADSSNACKASNHAFLSWISAARSVIRSGPCRPPSFVSLRCQGILRAKMPLVRRTLCPLPLLSSLCYLSSQTLKPLV